jgi:group I intron endonuclease
MELFKGIIYRVTSPSNKIYYGMSLKSLEHRRKKHLQNMLNGFTLPFHNALRKYGIENFKWEIIEKYQSKNKKELILLLYEREILYIAKDNTTNKKFGYNVSPGGSGSDIFSMLSKERQQEVRNIISSGVKKKWKDEKYRAKVIKSRNTKEYKELKSKQSKEQWKDPTVRQKSLDSFKEKIWNNSDRNEKIRNSLKNQKKFKCPYCNNEYTRGNYNRWHGERCRFKRS